MKLVLPKPPSINHIYGLTSVGGYAHSYITLEGKAWFEECIFKTRMWGLKYKIPKYAKTKLKVDIELYTNVVGQDLDNINKPVLDLLQKAFIIDNDKYIYELHSVKKMCDKDQQRIELSLSPLE